MGGVGIERNFREAMGFEYGPDIEIETVTHNLYINIVLTAILIERFEVGIDMRMLPDKTEDVLFITLQNLCNTGIGLPRSDLTLAEVPIDRFPIPKAKPIELDVTHIPDADRPIEITKNKFFHRYSNPPIPPFLNPFLSC
jgi:hypothetical protein